MNRGTKNAIIFTLSLFIILVLTTVFVVLNNTSKAADRIFEGIYIKDEYVGGMTKDEAKKIAGGKVW
ncbi:hypothetical protein [Thermobrachium celere]|uniref:hypothetical protein n=1 Tax=Thermobrachium celere TaxID=53422 RepID=UPI0019420A1C|nr:hypothetical protein [Thermobrachium celere]GFR35479.1 hypothetical protein TCEA9_12910 [Thermobrachium celere]